MTYLIKVFWGAKEPQGAEVDPEQLKSFEQKLQQVIDQNKSTSSTNPDGAPQSEELEKLRSEIYTLRQTLKEKEELAQQKPDVIASPAEVSAPASEVGGSADLTEEIANYKKKIEELETRLSDYEVIAEDISDLHRLREENEKLKAQVSGTDVSNQVEPLEIKSETVAAVEVASVTAAEGPEETPVAESESMPEAQSESKGDAVAVEAPSESKPLSSEDLANSLDDLLAQAAQPKTGSEESSNEPVTEEAKKLLSDFEKAKGST